MGSRLKEDEKNERIIRGLLKQPGNRKCINCNVLGPQYVCITFSTFICTTCSGIHREFTHRVKSVSMAKFSPQEVASLQAGGNERAKEIFFKDWESQNPDGSNVDKVRNFIKHVYVDRRYTGERSVDKPSQVNMGDKEQRNENRRSDPYRSGSRSPPYEEERRSSDRPNPGHDGRSPGYVEDNRRHSDYGRSPVRSGIVSVWRRENRFSNGRMSDDRQSSDGEFKLEIRSPDSQTDSSISSPPVVRPVRDILGENVIPLRISEPPRANSRSVAEGAVVTQRTASSSSLASSNGNPTELKRETSLVDFDAFSEPVAATQVQQSAVVPVGQSVSQETSTPSDDNWACFDNFTENSVSQTPPNTNPLESVISELFVPTNDGVAPTPSNDMFSSGSSGNFLFDSGGSTSATALPETSMTSSVSILSPFPSGGMGPGVAPTMPENGGAQWRGMQNPQQPSTVAVNQLAASQLVSGYPSGLSSQGIARNPVSQASHAFAQAPQAVPAPAPAGQTTEADASRQQALPADLFTATYTSFPYQTPGWQTGVHPGMVYPMQYNTAMSIPTFPQPIKSANPFDVNAEASPSQPQPAVFPSMSSLHTALPNMAASSLGGARPSWMPHQQPSYPSAMPHHGSTFTSPLPGAYMGQQLHNNMPPSRPQGFGTFGSEGTSFGTLDPAASTPNSSLGGNPFA